MSSDVGDRIRELIYQQTDREWLINYNNREFLALFEQYDRQFLALTLHQPLPQILLAHPDPWHYLAALLAAIAHDYPVFLANPQWQVREWQQVSNLLQPDVIIGDSSLFTIHNDSPLPPVQLPPHAITIATGGSSGQIRFAIHNWQTLMASIQGFCQYFAVETVNSCCVLPIYHVSGLMQFLRSFVTGGQFCLNSYKNMPLRLLESLNLADWSISLVPTQLQTLLNQPESFLAKFGVILLGGAPAWQTLLNKARAHRLNLATTYGMTETASQVATLKPKDFLAGNHSSGQILPHAQAHTQNERGEALPSLQTGAIAIRSQSQFWGYYPQFNRDRFPLVTDDVGYFDSDGYLHVLGRNSQKIITGGENVYPKEVESALLATHLLEDVAVVGIEDEQWGQAIAAVYVPIGEDITASLLKDKLGQQLVSYKIPKYWLKMNKLARNAQGKLIYSELRTQVQDFLETKL
jgi:O-succinylbenzoic acid--CoA ligase